LPGLHSLATIYLASHTFFASSFKSKRSRPVATNVIKLTEVASGGNPGFPDPSKLHIMCVSCAVPRGLAMASVQEANTGAKNGAHDLCPKQVASAKIKKGEYVN